MVGDYLTTATHLLGALLAGAAIGLERSYHGRPAGFRTHVLVCLASSLLMLVTLYQWQWLPGVPLDTVRTDPTRMAQGVMTGIGFLGAGVIFKEGLSVRGLTTAASIWITAAIGILFGVGFYFPAILATLLTLGTLSLFRWVEARMPGEFYAHHALRFDDTQVLPEAALRDFLTQQGFAATNISYHRNALERWFEYRMVIRSRRGDSASRLASSLGNLPGLRAFVISPTGD